MLKQGIVLFIACSIVGIANANFIPCPGNAKKPPIIYNGKKYGPWNVAITGDNNYMLKASTPGLIKVKNSTAPGLACYADNVWNPMNLNQNKKPIYDVVLTYTGKCSNPSVGKGGFYCG